MIYLISVLSEAEDPHQCLWSVSLALTWILSYEPLTMYINLLPHLYHIPLAAVTLQPMNKWPIALIKYSKISQPMNKQLHVLEIQHFDFK